MESIVWQEGEASIEKISSFYDKDVQRRSFQSDKVVLRASLEITCVAMLLPQKRACGVRGQAGRDDGLLCLLEHAKDKLLNRHRHQVRRAPLQELQASIRSKTLSVGSGFPWC